MSWNPPKIWSNSTAFILGGGPSVASHNLKPLVDKRVIGVNNSVFFGPDIVDVVWFGDVKWFDWHRDKLKNFPGIVATCCPKFDPQIIASRRKKDKLA